MQEILFHRQHPTVAEYCEKWLVMQSAKVSAATLKGYASNMRNYVIKPMGDMKVPYQPETGLGAKSNDPSSFVPYKTAVQASGYDGIGIGIFNGICAIDLDNFVSDSGYYTQTAAEIVALMHSYTEYSPSGNGLHILFSAKGFQYDTKRFYIMNHQAGIEAYVAGATSKYVTVTGNRCEDYEYGDRTQGLQVLLDKFMRRPEICAENSKATGCCSGSGANRTPCGPFFLKNHAGSF